MTNALKVGLVLLFVVILLTLAYALPLRAASVDLGRFETILVASRGHLLPRAPLEGGDDVFSGAISIGDLLLTSSGSSLGLQVATLAPGLKFQHHRIYDTAEDSTAGSSLHEQLDDAPVGTLFVVAVQGLVRPADGELATLDGFARKLGAELSPFRAPSASWAVISYKLATGWRVLAEAYSEDREVSLAFTVSPAPRTYRDFRSAVFYAPGDGPQTVNLFHDLASGDVLSGTILRDQWSRLAGTMKSSLVMPAAHSVPATVRWSNVMLGTQPYFTASLGKRVPFAATAIMRIQGQEVDRRELGSDLRIGWHPWRVDLSDWENKQVSLELSIEVPKGTPGSTVFLGLPELNWEHLE